MSYHCTNRVFSPVVNHFSNPDVIVNGKPTGEEDKADCARRLTDT